MRWRFPSASSMITQSAAIHSCTSSPECRVTSITWRIPRCHAKYQNSFFSAINAQHVIVVHLVSLEWIWIQYLLQFLGIRPTLAAQMDSLDLIILFFQFHYNKFSPPSDVTTHGRSSSDSGTKHFWWQLHWFHRVFDTGCFDDFLFLSHSWLLNRRKLPSFSETLTFRTIRWIRRR